MGRAERERERDLHTGFHVSQRPCYPQPTILKQCLSHSYPFVFSPILDHLNTPFSSLLSPRHKNMKFFFFLPFSNSKFSIRFHHILVKQLHQENDSACGINYACSWPETKGCEVGEGRIVRHTQIKSPCISQMDPISSSYCLKSSCT